MLSFTKRTKRLKKTKEKVKKKLKKLHMQPYTESEHFRRNGCIGSQKGYNKPIPSVGLDSDDVVIMH